MASRLASTNHQGETLPGLPVYITSQMVYRHGLKKGVTAVAPHPEYLEERFFRLRQKVKEEATDRQQKQWYHEPHSR